MAVEQAPEPQVIYEIGMGLAPGDRDAAVEAFRRLGEVAGDTIAQALTLVDGLAVLGGGISGAHRLFLPALVAAMNDVYVKPGGVCLRRLLARAFDFEDSAARAEFLRGESREIAVPGGAEPSSTTRCRTAVGISRLGTSRAVAIGAYAFALRKLDEDKS